MLNELSTKDLERYKVDLQIELEQNKHHLSILLEAYKSAVQIGQNALRLLFLLNGGASIALLPFIARLIETQKDKVPLFAPIIGSFVLGAFSATIASALSYLSQCYYLYNEKEKATIANRLRYIAILIVVISFLFFACGMWNAFEVFSHW